MKNKIIKLPEIHLIGFSVRTNNKNEMNPETAKIGGLISSFFSNQQSNHILHRLNPGVTYSVYTDYDSDEHGEYIYFFGEAVTSIENQDLTKFKSLHIPESHYQKLTTESGKMPDVVISAWQKIWTMNEIELGGKRKYIADFEIYDEKASDPNNSVVDIYIGIH